MPTIEAKTPVGKTIGGILFGIFALVVLFGAGSGSTVGRIIVGVYSRQYRSFGLLPHSSLKSIFRAAQSNSIDKTVFSVSGFLGVVSASTRCAISVGLHCLENSLQLPQLVF